MVHLKREHDYSYSLSKVVKKNAVMEFSIQVQKESIFMAVLASPKCSKNFVITRVWWGDGKRGFPIVFPGESNSVTVKNIKKRSCRCDLFLTLTAWE